MLDAAIVHPDTKEVIPLAPEPIIKQDGLSSNAPHIHELEKHQMHYILGAKKGDHGIHFKSKGNLKIIRQD